MSRSIPFAAAMAVVAITCPAFATDPEMDSETPEPSTARHGSASQDFHLSGGPGFAEDRVLGGVFAHTLTLGYRYGHFEPAIVGNFGSAVFGGSYAALGMSLGAALQTENGARFTLRGVIGSDSYQGVGCGLFCQSGGAAATLPYAAVHAGASHVFWARGKTHLELGVEGFYGHDLSQKRVEYSTTGGLLSSSTETHSRTLGGQRVGIVATVGLTFDTAPVTQPRAKLAAR